MSVCSPDSAWVWRSAGGRCQGHPDHLFARVEVAGEGVLVNRGHDEHRDGGRHQLGEVQGPHLLVDGDRSVVEWVFDLTPNGGDRVLQKQAAVQTWRDGQIIREVFYHG